MPEFDAHQAIHEAEERGEQIAEGGKLVPVSAAIIAVCAALATLFSNHSSVSGLEKRTLAGIYQTRAADAYAYYQSSKLKIEINRSLLASGLVSAGANRAPMLARVQKEMAKSQRTLDGARRDESQANAYLDAGEHDMRGYEDYEIAATLFEVSIVLVSITALMRTKALLWVAYAGTAVGLVYFLLGFRS